MRDTVPEQEVRQTIDRMNQSTGGRRHLRPRRYLCRRLHLRDADRHHARQTKAPGVRSGAWRISTLTFPELEI